MEQAMRILVVGGYGIVGSAITRLLADRNPHVTVVVAGRRREEAERHAARIPGAEAVRIDLTEPDPLAHLDPQPDVVVVAVNDRDDRLLRAAVDRGIPLVDIALWGERVEDVQELLGSFTLRSPVVLASGWMASAASVVLASLRQGRPRAAQVDIDILFALKDTAGPDSVTGFVDLQRPFTVHDHGTVRTVTGLTDPHRVTFQGNRTVHTRRLDSPEHVTYPATGLADGAAVRIAFDSAPTNTLFTLLVRSGIWGRLSRRTRVGLLHNDANTLGAPHEFLVTVQDATGTERVGVLDPQGQAHLTAASAVSQAERLAHLRDRVPPPVGISFPEQAADPAADVAALREMGVQVSPQP